MNARPPYITKVIRDNQFAAMGLAQLSTTRTATHRLAEGRQVSKHNVVQELKHLDADPEPDPCRNSQTLNVSPDPPFIFNCNLTICFA